MENNQVILEEGIKIDVLGEIYNLYFISHEEMTKLKGQGVSGTVNYTTKDIFVSATDNLMKMTDGLVLQLRVVRHELVHAFLEESGLSNNSMDHPAWAANEEMVDWIAMQIPKMNKAYDHVIAMLKEKCPHLDFSRVQS